MARFSRASLSQISPYAAAAAAVAVVAALRSPGLWGDRVPPGVFLLAVIVSAWTGGFGPGVFATGLSLLAETAFLPSSAPPQSLAVFLLNGCLISLAGESLRRRRWQLDAAREAEKSPVRFHETDRHFRLMADSAPVLVWMSNSAEEYTWFNRPWLAFRGRAMEQETGDGWLEGIHPDDRERHLEISGSHFETRTPFEMDYRLMRHDGVHRWVMDRGIPLFTDQGDFQGYIGSCTDIHERKEEEETSEALLKIEQTARAEAERSATLKDEFFATISHEMRTPLTAILGWVQLLRNGSLADDTIPQALETIERNARAQARLIDDLLDMSRILSGRLRLDVQRVELAGIVAAAITVAEPAAVAKSIRLASIPAPQPVAVSGDAGRLQQIVWNLLNNAIRFTPPGGTVTIAVAPEDSQVRVSVRDTGEGIAPEFLPHVFEHFRQQDASSGRRHQGLGLGLCLVKELVELHGGTAGAQSEGPGKGSTFSVLLPVAARASDLPREKRAVSLPESAVPERDIPSLLGTRVLVVDDDSDARELLRSILAKRGASVRTAGSAAEAIRQFEARCPDVLVSDIGMPGKDGYELIHSIRALERNAGSRIPAIALTAFASLDDRRRAIGAGFHMHLSKPIEPIELVTVVATLARR